MPVPTVCALTDHAALMLSWQWYRCECCGSSLRIFMAMFANNALLGGEVWIQEQRKIKRSSKTPLSLWWQTWTSLSLWDYPCPQAPPKYWERGLVTLATFLVCTLLVCAESAYYVTITCLLWSRGSQLLFTMALQSRWTDLPTCTERSEANPVRQEYIHVVA